MASGNLPSFQGPTPFLSPQITNLLHDNNFYYEVMNVLCFFLARAKRLHKTVCKSVSRSVQSGCA